MNQAEDPEEEEGGGLQLEVLKSYLSFGIRAVSMHRWLAGSVFAVVAGITLALLAVWPRTYYTETKLMAQASKALSPDENATRDLVNFKGAYETIMRHDNLVSVVRQTNLVKHWGETRPFALRMKDTLFNLRGKPSDKDMEAVLVATVKDRLQVQAGDGVLTLSVYWPDPGMAARLLEVVRQNFLEARHVAEISTIADYIAILEGHAAKLRHEIDRNVETIEHLREQKLAQYGRKADGAAATPAAPATAPDAPAEPVRRIAAPVVRSAADEEEIARLKVKLEAKQRAMAELEDNRGRRLAEEQARLRELSVKFTAEHPLVENAKQNVRALSEESQQFVALRNEVQALQNELGGKKSVLDAQTVAVGGRRRAAAAAGGATGGSGGEPLPPEVLRFMQDSTGDTFDPAVAAQFRHAVEKYMSLRGTISTARIDLDTAQAAFQYRYKLMVPAEAPSKPIKPKVPLVALAGILGGLLFGAAAATIAALRTDRIVERWQVQQLQLPVLSELRLPEYRQ